VTIDKLKELLKIPPQLEKQIEKTDDRLKEEGKLISKELSYDIYCIQQIRNIYAHTRLVKQKPASDEIKDWTEKTSTYQHLIPLWKRERKAGTDYEVYLQVVNNIIKKLRRIHGQIWTDRLNDLDQKLINAKARQMKLKLKK